jgi:hypothetical protein
MNNTGDITNSAIFLNFGGRGFAKRFGDAQDSYYTKVNEAINKTAETRNKEKKAFVEKFTSDTKKITDETLKEDKKRIEEKKKKEVDFLKPLIEARKQTYEKTKQMRYDLTLLENKYHNYIIKNIDDLPKKIAALKKAFEYVRNTKLANKELSLKKKEFYKKQMDSYIKQWNKLNADGSIKLQALRNMYRLNLDLSLKKENEDKIKERFITLQKQLEELKFKLEEAKINNNQQDIDKYSISIDNIQKIFAPVIVKEKEVAVYIQKVDTLYDRFKKFTTTNINRLIDYPFSFDIN